MPPSVCRSLLICIVDIVSIIERRGIRRTSRGRHWLKRIESRPGANNGLTASFRASSRQSRLSVSHQPTSRRERCARNSRPCRTTTPVGRTILPSVSRWKSEDHPNHRVGRRIHPHRGSTRNGTEVRRSPSPHWIGRSPRTPRIRWRTESPSPRAYRRGIGPTTLLSVEVVAASPRWELHATSSERTALSSIPHRRRPPCRAMHSYGNIRYSRSTDPTVPSN